MRSVVPDRTYLITDFGHGYDADGKYGKLTPEALKGHGWTVVKNPKGGNVRVTIPDSWTVKNELAGKNRPDIIDIVATDPTGKFAFSIVGADNGIYTTEIQIYAITT